LDALQADERSAVLAEYAVSPAAKRAVRILKALMFVAVAFCILGFATPQLLDPAPSGRAMVSTLTTTFWVGGVCAAIYTKDLKRISKFYEDEAGNLSPACRAACFGT